MCFPLRVTETQPLYHCSVYSSSRILKSEHQASKLVMIIPQKVITLLLDSKDAEREATEV